MDSREIDYISQLWPYYVYTNLLPGPTAPYLHFLTHRMIVFRLINCRRLGSKSVAGCVNSYPNGRVFTNNDSSEHW